MKTKIILTILLGLGLGSVTYSQVGIGNPSPDSTSVLDLTNPNNRGLVLPKAISTSGMSNNVDGMTYFFKNFIYYKTDSGYNSLTPWKFKFKGNITNDVYYNLGGNIGIGNTDLSASPEAPLQVESVDLVDLVNNGSFLIGKSTSTNIAINDKEIQSRNAGSSAPLTINEDGGDVTFGSNDNKVNVKASDRMQELHSPTNTYYDLLPAGTIVMWYGNTTNVPTGWAICDGLQHMKSDSSGIIITPNLSGRFILAPGFNGETSYNVGGNGGQDKVALTENQMPSHTHSLVHDGATAKTQVAGLHNHRIHAEDTEIEHSNDGSMTDDIGMNHPGRGYTANAGEHWHYLQGNTGQRGNGQAHENRPRYYVVVYMMKL